MQDVTPENESDFTDNSFQISKWTFCLLILKFH